MTTHPRTLQRDRNAFILDALTREGHVEVDGLAEGLGVSTATIRRDLDTLAHKQLLIRIRGGAVTNSSTYDLPIQYNAFRHATEKRRIAHAAAQLIRPGSVVGLNAGTTTTEVARALAIRPDLESVGRETTLTVVTNAINIAHELTVRSQFQLLVIGGMVRPESYELIGPLSERALDHLSLDEAVLSANGLSAVAGVTCNNLGEAAIGSRMVSRAKKVTLVLDSSKFDESCLATMCRLDQIDRIVTDAGIDEHCESVRFIQDSGIELIVAEEPKPSHDKQAALQT